MPATPSSSKSVTARTARKHTIKHTSKMAKAKLNKGKLIPHPNRVHLGPNAWYDLIKNNPLKVPKDVYTQLAALAPERELYKYAAFNCVSKHFGSNYAVKKEWVDRIEQKLGASQMPILHPPKAAGWRYVQRFKDFMDTNYPAPPAVLKSSNSAHKAAHERNLAVVKVYKTGMDSISEHNDAQSHTDVPIASLSVGATRTMVVREAKAEKDPVTGKQKQRRKWNIPLAHGDIFVMGGDDFQTTLTHALPVEKHVTEGRAVIVLRSRKDKLEVKEEKMAAKAKDSALKTAPKGSSLKAVPKGGAASPMSSKTKPVQKTVMKTGSKDVMKTRKASAASGKPTKGKV